METIIILIFLIIILFLASYFSIKFFINTAKKSAINSKDAYICPNCGSTSFSSSSKQLSGTGLSLRGAISTSNKYICNGCDYEGIFPIIDKNSIEDFRKSLKNKNAGDGI